MANVLESKWRRKRELMRDKHKQAYAAKNAMLDVCLKRDPPSEWGRQLDHHVVNAWGKLPDPDKPYCYVEYVGKSRAQGYAETLSRTYGWSKKQAEDYASMVFGSDPFNPETPFMRPIAKRNFENYTKAITHLTKVKLSIVEDDENYREFTPCKIVEGCYTRDGREHITKVTEFPNVSNRMGRDDPSSGQSREQRGPNISVSQTLGAYGRATSGSGWTITDSIGTATVDLERTSTVTVPIKYWVTSTTTAC